jgi:undecaprenyl-diphosphatase
MTINITVRQLFRRVLIPTSALALTLLGNSAWAGGGPLGIDHRLNLDNSGIWNRNIQLGLEYSLIGIELVGGFWEGGETRLGKTLWQSIDSSAIGAVTSEAMKHIFTRARPSQTNNPNSFFQGGSHYSFPSGEVTLVSSVITPFVLEYREDHPAIYALELLPVYDGIARMKAQGHWQTDVLTGFAIGTLAGYYAHHRDSPLILSVMPHAVFIGFRRAW